MLDPRRSRRAACSSPGRRVWMGADAGGARRGGGTAGRGRASGRPPRRAGVSRAQDRRLRDRALLAQPDYPGLCKSGSQRRQSERARRCPRQWRGRGGWPAPGPPALFRGRGRSRSRRRGGCSPPGLPSPLGSSAWEHVREDCEDLSRFLRLAEQQEGNFLGFPLRVGSLMGAYHTACNVPRVCVFFIPVLITSTEM